MEKTKKKSLFNKFLDGVEKVGNKLPHPIALFALLALSVILISALLSKLGVTASGNLVNRKTGTIDFQTIEVISLLNTDGLVYMLTNAVSNFTGFAPLGLVLVAMLGVGVAESSGYISALLKRTVEMTSAKWITPVVILLGVLSNVAGSTGYVVLIPIGALMFKAYGKHPIAGLAAAFAGVSGGFSANLIIGSLDPLLAGITNEAIKIVDPNYSINPASNWYFMMISTFLIVILGTLVTEKLIIPRLGTYKEGSGTDTTTDDLTSPMEENEKKALKSANIVLLLMIVGMIILLIPQNSFLRNPETGSIVDGSPFMDSIVVLIFFYFFIPAVVFGKISKTFKDHRDACNAMAKSMATMSAYIALVFVSAQFISYFNYTKVGTIIALKGANFFEQVGFGPYIMMTLFILFSGFANLFMGSASAKWTILAPVFVPMFMLLGYAPELTQAAFRIGDSVTNIITPILSNFVTIIIFAQRHDREVGMGTLISTMFPYSVVFLIGWIILLLGWMALGLPLGPGAQMLL